MKYSEVPAIQAALAKGYSDIWAAKTAEAANAALEASKENLLKTVKEYVKYLADTVYNNGAPTELNGNSYTVSKENYGVAVDAIDSATMFPACSVLTMLCSIRRFAEPFPASALCPTKRAWLAAVR